MHRRALLLALSSAPVLLFTSEAFAGSYLDRSALLLDGSRRDAEALRAKLTDKELAKVVEAVADARQTAASKMDVPAKVAKAHPHLLLTLANVERAAQAAIEGRTTQVLEHLESSKREETIFRSTLSELGFPLPKATHAS